MDDQTVAFDSLALLLPRSFWDSLPRRSKGRIEHFVKVYSSDLFEELRREDHRNRGTNSQWKLPLAFPDRTLFANG